MRLKIEKGIFVFECRFDERRIPKEARFWWNQELKRWQTTSIRCAKHLMRYATDEVRETIRVIESPQFHERSIAPGKKASPGAALRRMQAKAHERHFVKPAPESPGWMQLPVRKMEGLESLSKKYEDSIREGRRIGDRLGE